MELAVVHSTTAAFVAGLITSLHCAGMCGPLACMLMPSRGDRADAQTVASTYHLCRLTGYAMLGAVAGGLGRTPLSWLPASAVRWLPWALVLFLIALALRWDRFIPKATWFSMAPFRLQGWMRGRSRVQAAAALGLMTPLLPCGPLYFITAMALLSGSALRGVEFMLAFGLGTVPLLWLAQSQFQWLRQKLSPVWLGRVRVALACTAAMVVGWRLRGTLGFASASLGSSICF